MYMKPEVVLAYEFVEFIPEELKERTLYISINYCTVLHKCCCGCGREVVTPLSPTAWQLIFDGTTVSLYPSIGSWSLPCQSHYFITNNQVVWAPKWTKKQIGKGRAQEARSRQRYYGRTSRNRDVPQTTTSAVPLAGANAKESLWQKISKWFS
jgi:hypothetical protein